MADAAAIVELIGGLDNVTPIQSRANGTLIDALNYEVAPIKGYSRIQGYERFDNQTDGGIANLYVARFDVTSPTPGEEIPLGSSVVENDFSGNVLATLVGLVEGTENVYYYVSAVPGSVAVTGRGYRIIPPSGPAMLATAVSTPVDYREAAADWNDYITTINNISEQLRIRVQLPSRPISGVAYGHDAAFVVVDLPLWNFTTGAVPVVGELYGFGGQVFQVGSVDGRIATMILTPNTIALGGVSRLTYNNILTNTTGTPVAGVDTEFSNNTSGLYGQPFVLNHPGSSSIWNRGYTALVSNIAVRYINGSEKLGTQVDIAAASSDVTMLVTSQSVDSGSFDNGDASGWINLGGLFSLSPTFTGVIGVGDDLEVGGIVVGEIAEVVYPLWSGTKGLRVRNQQYKREHTHYVWGTYNFLATEGTELTFATNGYTRAGYINTSAQTYGVIVTQADAEKDRPKYVSYHAGQRLTLGFDNGSVQMSSLLHPFNFSGFDGAIEVGSGDVCTGLLEATDDSTLVYGSRSIRRIIGRGTDMDVRTVASSSGAMDYTAQTVGGEFFHTNQNGICTLEQTSAYGDFKFSSMSGLVDPWLTPRIVQDSSSIELGGVVGAMSVRAKNQYRLFLGDGNVVSMALTPDGPQIMKTNYQVSANSLRIPLAWFSGVSDEGQEYVLAVWDRVKAAAGNRGIVERLPADNIPYRLDYGWGFDGEVFPSFIETSYIYNEEPQFLTIDRAIVYGMGYGSAGLILRAKGIEDDFSQPYSLTNQDISMPRNNEILYTSLRNVMGQVDHANWGRAVSLRIESNNIYNVPHHILQSLKLFIQTEGVTE